MTREEAIVWCDRFNNAWANADPEADFPDLKYSDTLDQLFYIAGQALRQQETVTNRNGFGEPLTLDELLQMNGEPVWIVEYPDWGHWELSADAGDYVAERDYDCYGMKHDDPAGRYGLHKLGWLAYRQNPEEAVTNRHRMTNADRIRAMSDEEMVVFLDGFIGRCLDCAEDAKNKSCPIYKEGHYCRPKDIMEWLQMPAEEDGHD